MASSETDICNLALAELGVSPVMSINDPSNEAIACKQFYAQTLDEALRSHPWNFATKREELSRLPQTPLFDWNYQYQLPSDFIRLRKLNATTAWMPAAFYAVEGRKLLTNWDTARIRYIARTTDANLFDPLFVEALSVKLAAKIAAPLTGSREKGTELIAKYEQIIAPLAARVDAGEDRPRKRMPYQDSDLVKARFGGR